jgi:hypothetical protein
VLTALPLILGIASLLAFAVYFYSANHAPYRYTDIIVVGPVLAFLGVIISILTREQRKQSPVLWVSGLLVCAVGILICIGILILLIAFAAAMSVI